MKTKTSELTGAALDWAAAKCQGMGYIHIRDGVLFVGRKNNRDSAKQNYRPSTDWAQGGPIIDREGIATWKEGDSWRAIHPNDNGKGYYCAPIGTLDVSDFDGTPGLSPLIAAMRCYVASKLGDEVDVPEELL